MNAKDEMINAEKQLFTAQSNFDRAKTELAIAKKQVELLAKLYPNEKLAPDPEVVIADTRPSPA